MNKEILDIIWKMYRKFVQSGLDTANYSGDKDSLGQFLRFLSQQAKDE